MAGTADRSLQATTTRRTEQPDVVPPVTDLCSLAMTSVWGECPPLPRAVCDRASAHAFSLGRQVVADDLFLVAVAGLDEAHPARQALAAEQIDEDQLLSLVRVRGDGAPAVPLTFAPAYFQLEGRAQGFAAALGDGRVTPEHVLLALLWDPGSSSSYLLWRLGVPRERIIERLRDLGVPTPRAPLPEQRQIEWGPRVWFDRTEVRSVVDYLRAGIPPGTRWGFNYADDRAWAIAEAHVDLPALVSAAIGGVGP
jgi:hypothetical protein